MHKLADSRVFKNLDTGQEEDSYYLPAVSFHTYKEYYNNYQNQTQNNSCSYLTGK